MCPVRERHYPAAVRWPALRTGFAAAHAALEIHRPTISQDMADTQLRIARARIRPKTADTALKALRIEHSEMTKTGFRNSKTEEGF
jgi:hypothetical protein